MNVITSVPRDPIRDNFDLFLAELQRQFGDPNLQETSRNKLKLLQMRENQTISGYLNQFTTHAINTGSSDGQLRDFFYDGLPDRLKDLISTRGKPATLRGMQDLARELDSAYWIRDAERKVKALTNPLPRTTRTTNTSTTTTNRPPWLTPSGHLTEAERARREKEGLCLRCGKAGHTAQNCSAPPLAQQQRNTTTTTTNTRVGRVAVTLSAIDEPEATIEEAPEGSSADQPDNPENS